MNKASLIDFIMSCLIGNVVQFGEINYYEEKV